MKNLRDPRLKAVVKAAYNLGRFQGRQEESARVQREMAVARTAISAMAEEIKYLDDVDRGLVIRIDLTTARAARKACEESFVKAHHTAAAVIDRKLKALKSVKMADNT